MNRIDKMISMDNMFSFFKKTPVEIEKLISAQIRMIRRRRKISQQKLSELSGVSLGFVKRFERTGEISLLSLVKIAIALDIEKDLEDLFAEIPPQSIEEIYR